MEEPDHADVHDPIRDANEASAALRGLAHATRTVEDPPTPTP
jgi:hypothetical protein